jgi:hypothetical protein
VWLAYQKYFGNFLDKRPQPIVAHLGHCDA